MGLDTLLLFACLACVLSVMFSPLFLLVLVPGSGLILWLFLGSSIPLLWIHVKMFRCCGSNESREINKKKTFIWTPLLYLKQ